MLTLEECKKYLKEKDISDERITEIRDFLYAVARESVIRNISKYEQQVISRRRGV